MVPCGETRCARAGIFIWIFASTARRLTGTIRLEIPVETNSIGSDGARSLGFRPSAAASVARVNVRARETCGPLRHGDAHRAAVVKRQFHGKNSGAGLLQDVHAAFGSGDDAEFSEQEPRADYGMAGQRQFARGGENAQASKRAIIRGPLDENSFRKIHLARDGLHFRGGNAVAIGDDRERISREGLGGENIERVESAIHLVPLSGRPGSGRAR